MTLAGAALVALAAIGHWTERPRRERAETAESQLGAATRTDYPSLREVPSLPSGSPRPLAPEERVKEVAELVGAWRNAILQRDPDAVTRLDVTFREAPDVYASALIENATSDPEDRVRAFSTRVLGKLRRPALVQVFRQLLDDRSSYVRENAAWALGELSPDHLR